MSEYVKAWQCIGCGKIEAPQTCVGVCQDRRVEFVYADEHRGAIAQLQHELARERSRAAKLAALVRQLAGTTPHPGEWERSYRALAAQASRLLATLPQDAAGPEC